MYYLVTPDKLLQQGEFPVPPLPEPKSNITRIESSKTEGI